MDKKLILGILAAIPVTMMGQSAVDAYNISQGNLRGTARYMSMAGAFTALGGDMSTLNQNPAGIGIYRSSEASLTLALDNLSTKSEADGFSSTKSRTPFSCNNVGYIGTVRLPSEVMPFFNWGFSYSTLARFNRHYSGRLTDNLQTSYTNYIADYTSAEGIGGNILGETTGYNPYMQSNAPWSSILAYNAYGINPTAPGADSYVGLFNYDSTQPGSAEYQISESGHIDEYSINFGGNLYNTVYWGLGFGITDIDFKQEAYYGEAFTDANVPNAAGDAYTSGDASMGLSNYKHIWGSGFNVKFGLIFKPINELRLGFAVHTPTWYNLSQEGGAAMHYLYNSPTYPNGENYNGSFTTDPDGFDWDYQTPWRIMAGVAGVIGGRAIVSLDYEYKAFDKAVIKDANSNEYVDMTSDVKTYFRPTNTIRVGAEYRLTPQWSIRAGYSYETSPVKSELLDPTGDSATCIYTSGPDDTETQPSFTWSRDTQHFTLGLGYRYKAFSVDLAYVHRSRTSDYHAFTDYNENVEPYYLVVAPQAKLTDNDNSFVLSLSYKF